MDDEEHRVRAVYERYGQSPRRARAWSASNPGNLMIRDEVATAVCERAGGLRSGDVLDVGCGTGWWLRALAESGVAIERLHGVDLLASRVEAVKRALPGADVRQADARSLPWPDGRFRLVTIFLVLSSQSSREIQRTSLREALRVLEPGGGLIIWEPRLPNPTNRSTRLLTRGVLRDTLGPDFTIHPVTVHPLIARRLGPRPAAYRAIARTRALCSHRLIHHAKASAGTHS